MKLLPSRLQQLLDTLEALDRADRIQMLIELADQFHPVPSRIAQRPFPAEHRVPGCESEAYVWSEPDPKGNLTYYFAVENPQGISAMALAGILDKSLSGIALDEVAEVSADVIYRIFGPELSMGKSLGLMGMVNMVRSEARQQLRTAKAGASSTPLP
jgi:cysteine desulfuration protein SufE